MKVKSILVATLLIITFACDNDNDTPKETSLLTVSIDASYQTDESDDWIIVHSEDGTLLAHQSFETNQQLEIVTDKPVPGKITVTHLKYILWDGRKDYMAKSHVNMQKGKHMVFKRSRISLPEKGKVNINVSDVYYSEHQSVSNPVVGYFSAGWSSGTNILDLQTGVYGDFSKYLVTISDGNAFKYRMLTNVQPGEKYSFSFNDMDDVEEIVDFTFPQANSVMLHVTGIEPGVTVEPNAYTVMFRYLSNTSTTIKAGYIDLLTNYRTSLLLDYSGYQYEYSNIGSVPNGEVTWPQKADFNITEKSLTNFSATSSKPYVWRRSLWGYNDVPSKTTIDWQFLASSGTQFVKEIPPEITSIHPVLTFSNLEYSATTFYTESPPFESVANSNFEAAAEPNGLKVGILISTD